MISMIPFICDTKEIESGGTKILCENFEGGINLIMSDQHAAFRPTKCPLLSEKKISHIAEIVLAINTWCFGPWVAIYMVFRFPENEVCLQTCWQR